MITFICEECGTAHSVPDKWAGKNTKCPCGRRNQVPTSAFLVEEPEEATESEFNFTPHDGEFPSIAVVPRTRARKRTPWWIPLVKYLTSVAAAIAIFLAYRHYYLHEPWKFWEKENVSEASSTTLPSPGNMASE